MVSSHPSELPESDVPEAEPVGPDDPTAADGADPADDGATQATQSVPAPNASAAEDSKNSEDSKTSADSKTSEDSKDYDDYEPRVIRLRLVPWDVVTTLVFLAVLLYLVTMTGWTDRLWAFTDDLCTGDECPPVPFGVNYYIYPLMWGGIGAAFTAAVFGPLVSLLRGWFMCFWPIVSVGVLTLASVFGYAATGFSQRYWQIH